MACVSMVIKMTALCAGKATLCRRSARRAASADCASGAKRAASAGAKTKKARPAARENAIATR